MQIRKLRAIHSGALLASLALADAATATIRQEEAAARETVAGGTVHTVRLAPGELSDSSRPTQPRRAGEAPGGDFLLEDEGGEASFLGFAAGRHVPPSDERVDPGLRQAASFLPLDGRPDARTWAYVMFSARITEQRLAQLEDTGARPLGFHPHYAIKVAIEPNALDAVAALPFVRWVGLPRPWQKLHPVLVRELEAQDPEAELELWVTVFESDLGPASTSRAIGSVELVGPEGVQPVPAVQDLPRLWTSNGWQQAALEAVGARVLSYVDEGSAFRARIGASELTRLAALDLVQFVELAVPAAPMHDESMAMVHADRARLAYDGGTNQVAVAGEVDWGIENSHFDLNHIYGVGWNLGPSTQSAWDDGCGHGTHVAGTIFGNGDTVPALKGAAPRLGWGPNGRFFNVKIGSSFCGTVSVDLQAVLDKLHTSYNDGTYTTVRPHVINHSWGSASVGPWYGSEFDARLLDNDILTYRQLHVWAAGNDGPGGQTLNLQSSAKNTFSVGNVNTFLNTSAGYPGNLWTSSSRGPTADLRWGPNICAPGVSILSANAADLDGHTTKTGTSMAAPHVTGIAAQLVDKHAFLRHNPTTLGAVLMASALTKDDQLLAGPSTSSSHHYNLYGAGRVEAHLASGGNSQQAMYFWGWSTVGGGSWNYVDFPVSTGATRVTVVLYYHEGAASAGASSALNNDLDMYLDVAPFDSAGDAGEYFAHQSGRDNVEIRMINAPTVAGWRVKVWPESTVPFSTMRIGVCAIVDYADTTPDTTLSVTGNHAYRKPGEQVDFSASLFSPSFVASAPYLETSYTSGGARHASQMTLVDGIVADLSGNNHQGAKIELGSVRYGTSRIAKWTMSWATQGVKSFTVSATADNMPAEQKTATVIVDGSGPSTPGNLRSTSHDVGVVDCDFVIDLLWNASSDTLSGLAGYRIEFDHSPSTVPASTSLNVAAGATSYQKLLATTDLPWYVHLRPRDNAGNWGTTAHAGPYYVSAYYNYCPATVSSSGFPGHLGFSGSNKIQANNLLLRATSLAANQPCLFFYGPNEILLPFGNGFRCVGGSIFRLPLTSTSGSGYADQHLDYDDLPAGGAITAGSTWKFQNWFRDPVAGGAAFNYSDALSITFCP